jgi:hypothetical protein
MGSGHGSGRGLAYHVQIPGFNPQYHTHTKRILALCQQPEVIFENGLLFTYPGKSHKIMQIKRLKSSCLSEEHPRGLEM